ncbi:MAG: hypothetical protein IT436_16955 [Phycisphaerales bacterium]|nr:hypothetical protein [Phycisphaerales bacterium]
MILDRTEQLVASSIGWVEGGALSVRNLATNRVTHHPVCDGGYLRLFPIDGDRFLAAAHRVEHDEIVLSVRRFAAPNIVEWSLRCTPHDHEFAGTSSATNGMPRHHLVTFKNEGRWTSFLLEVSEDAKRMILGNLPWYNGDEYDLGYQGLTDVIAMPSSGQVLVSVQRSSTLIVHDVQSETAIGRINLADRGGNPMLRIVGNELWTVDYDTFVRVPLDSRQPACAILVQPGTGPMRQFAGDVSVWKHGRRAIVPRPFSGDVAMIDPVSGTIERNVALGQQPLTCVATSNGRVIARDWKSGDWLEGQIHSQARPWWRFW